MRLYDYLSNSELQGQTKTKMPEVTTNLHRKMVVINAAIKDIPEIGSQHKVRGNHLTTRVSKNYFELRVIYRNYKKCYLEMTHDLGNIAKDADKCHRDKHIATMVGSGVHVLGGIAIATGVLASVVLSGGTSLLVLAPTIGGAVSAGIGGATVAGTRITTYFIDQNTKCRLVEQLKKQVKMFQKIATIFLNMKDGMLELITYLTELEDNDVAELGNQFSQVLCKQKQDAELDLATFRAPYIQDSHDQGRYVFDAGPLITRIWDEMGMPITELATQLKDFIAIIMRNHHIVSGVVLTLSTIIGSICFVSSAKEVNKKSALGDVALDKKENLKDQLEEFEEVMTRIGIEDPCATPNK